MSFTVRDGTRPTKRLCDMCRYARILKGPQQGHERVLCTAGVDSVELTFPVVQCNTYCEIGAMSDWEAKQIGWVLEVKAGRVMGFKPPEREGGPH